MRSKRPTMRSIGWQAAPSRLVVGHRHSRFRDHAALRLDSGSSGRKAVGVQVPLFAPR